MDNPEVINATDNLHEDMFKNESELVRAKKFNDVASAAQEAFQSAAYAAVAARAAIELSRSESQDVEDDSHLQRSMTPDMDSSHEPKLNIEEASTPPSKIDHSDDIFSFEKIHPDESSSSECEDEDIAERNQETHLEHAGESPEKPVKESKPSDPNLDSSNPDSISQNELENDKLVSKENAFASKTEISDEDIRVRESK